LTHWLTQLTYVIMRDAAKCYEYEGDFLLFSFFSCNT
jgi:hypothetical protein